MIAPEGATHILTCPRNPSQWEPGLGDRGRVCPFSAVYWGQRLDIWCHHRWAPLRMRQLPKWVCPHGHAPRSHRFCPSPCYHTGIRKQAFWSGAQSPPLCQPHTPQRRVCPSPQIPQSRALSLALPPGPAPSLLIPNGAQTSSAVRKPPGASVRGWSPQQPSTH